MQVLLSLLIGYLLGNFNPAALLSKRRKVNLRQEGTGNLGATNTLMVLGRRSGVMVLLLDIGKSYFSARLARYLFPQLLAAGLLASLGAILGHCFPVALHFQGGRGLASFGGMILAYNWKFFLLILVSGFLMMLLADAGVAATMTGCILFPFLVKLSGGDTVQFLLSIAASLLLTCMHLDKLKMAWELKGGDHIRDGLRKFVLGR